MEHGKALVCPKCRIDTLSGFNVESVIIDFCDQCGGAWFDREELAEYIDLSSDIPELTEMRKQARQTDLSCPKCDGRLEELPFSSETEFLVDRCPGCGGIFLDAGELREAEDASTRIETAQKRMSLVAKRLKERGFTLL